MGEVIIAALFVYLVYRFFAGFVIPVYRTTQQVKQQFGKMNGQAGTPPPGPQAPPRQPNAGNAPTPKPRADEYIDFEEL